MTAAPSTSPSALPEPGGSDHSTALYVFAVCRGDADPLSGITAGAGHEGGGPLRALRVGSLTALVQEVPADTFSAEALQRRLGDQRELERCARTHHRVISQAARRADTVPLPLATLYLGTDGLRAALGSDARRFHRALDRIAGRVEWGVKVHACATAPPPPPVRASAPAAGGSSGRAYLERVRGRNKERENRRDAALRAAEQVHAEFRGLAVAARRLRLHGTELTGESRPQLLNAAYLVADGQDRAVAAAVDRLRTEHGVAIELTGPWVPYSFADEEAVDDGR